MSKQNMQQQKHVKEIEYTEPKALNKIKHKRAKKKKKERNKQKIGIPQFLHESLAEKVNAHGRSGSSLSILTV